MDLKKFSYELIGKNPDYVQEYLSKLGYLVKIQALEPKKDKEILADEITINLKEETENTITIITSKFKKYIWCISYIFFHYKMFCKIY